jgi:hypothetical protein
LIGGREVIGLAAVARPVERSTSRGVVLTQVSAGAVANPYLVFEMPPGRAGHLPEKP